VTSGYRISGQWWLVLLLLTVWGCGLPGEVKDRARTAIQELDGADKKIGELQTAYDQKKSGAGFGFFETYARRENWSRYFGLARSRMKEARAVADNELVRLLDANRDEDARKVDKTVRRMVMTAREAIAIARTPQERMGKIRKARENAASLARRSAADMATIEGGLVQVRPLVDKALADYANRKEAIRKRAGSVETLAKQAQDASGVVARQFERHKTDGEADYADLLDSADKLAKLRSDFSTASTTLEKNLGDLDRSYVKILQDMRVDVKPYVVVARYEWSESVDWDTTKMTGTRKVFVDQKTWEKTVDLLNRNPDGFVNRSGYGWEEAVEEADQEFTYFHKYLLVENDEEKSTGWETVPESFFEQHEEDLGMEIASKPYGYFEDEVLTQAAPPGMSLVGNPRYGSWDDNGTPQNRADDFWVFYAKYHFFRSLLGLPGGRGYYGYGDWYGWNSGYRGRRPYYGKTAAGGPLWGTGGKQVRTSSRFRNTHFARTGGFKSQTPSVRGVSVRGGGPGGRGK
jgi:hypothetical protein